MPNLSVVLKVNLPKNVSDKSKMQYLELPINLNNSSVFIQEAK